MSVIFNKNEKSEVNGYTIGVSSGFSDIYFQKGGGSADVSNITLSGKAFYGAVKGVNFTQIDLETGVEFLEPGLEKTIKRIKDLGISFGIHGEMGRPKIALESALEVDYRDSHIKFIRNLYRSKEIGAKYYLLHSSESIPITRAGEHMQSTAIVDIYGRRFHYFLEENPDLIEWAANDQEILDMMPYRGLKTINEIRKDISKLKEQLKEIEENQKIIVENNIKKLENDIQETKKIVVDYSKTETMTFGPERIAYMLTAKWMESRGDPLWKGFVGNTKFEDIRKDYGAWVPAVASKYIYGHFHPEECTNNLPEFMKTVLLERTKLDGDPKKHLNKDFLFVIETPMVEKGMEEESRLAYPRHIIRLCRNIGCKYVKAVIDFEHALGAGININRELERLKSDDGKFVKVLHLGWPTPLQPAHYPIPLGSEQQEWLYKWIYELRKKGFDESEDRFIIFERAGGEDPIQQSVLALRKIIEYLRIDIPPDKLPLDFYGIEEKELKMQETQIREHALDPIKGLLVVPEERHTFLSRAAVEKGKGKEWETEKYR
jgi:hypothetical protein